MNLVEIKETKEYGLVTTSRIIAQGLGKRHDNVIRDLEEILKNTHNSNLRNLIISSNYRTNNQKRKYKEYLLTKDGFTLYMFNIQGYNDFKMAYINEFNRMEKALKEGTRNQHKQTKALPLTEKTYKGEKVLFIKDIAEIYKVSQGGLSAMASINNIGRILKGRELRGFKNKNSKCIYNSVACIRILNRVEFIALSRCTNLKPNDEIVSYYGSYEPKQEMSLYDKLKLTDLASDILSIARRKAGNSEYYKALNLVASKIYIDCGMLDEPCDDLSIHFHIGWNLQQPLIDFRNEVKNKLI